MRYYLHRLERCLFAGALIGVVQLALLAGNKTARASLAASAHTTPAKALGIGFAETTLAAGLILFTIITVVSAVTQRVRERRWYDQ